MHGQSRLQKRGSVYYFRAMVPKDLYVHYGRKEIIFSLKTKDYRDAKRLAGRASARLEEEFQLVRSQRPPERPRRVAVLDEGGIRSLCDTWRHECLSGDVWYRSQGLSESEFEDAQQQRSETLEALREILAKGRLDKITPALDQFLYLLGIEFCGTPEGRSQLTWAFLETAIETHTAIMRRDAGEVVPTPPAPRSSIAQGAAIRNDDNGDGPSFAACFEIWEAAVTDRSPKTVSDFRSVMNDFVAWAGDRPVSEYTREDAYAYADHIRKRDVLEPETVDKKLTYLRAIYNAEKRRLTLPDNPFSNIQVPRDRIKKVKRLPYDHSDLKKIFGSPIYASGMRELGGAGEAAAWLPLLALFTGARLEELGQLLLDDVCNDHGIDYLSITDVAPDGVTQNQSRRLKNAASRRQIPLHPELIQAGFLQYVSDLRKQNEVRLFPDLRPDCHGKWTGNWSKWWSRFRREKIGITTRLKPFHSFRHTFRDACRAAELDEEIADTLMGHSKNDKTGRRYGSGHPLAALQRAMVKIHYPGLTVPIIVTGSPPQDSPITDRHNNLNMVQHNNLMKDQHETLIFTTPDSRATR